MVHAVHATQDGEDVGVGAYPSEGPAGCAVVGSHGFHLTGEFLSHVTEGTSTQRFHHNALDTQFLAFAIEVFCIGIRPTATTHRGMTPVEEIHLYLYEVPVVFVVVVEQPVEVAHVTVIRESQMLDTACFALLEQEIEDAVVEEAALQRVHAATDAVQQVVVDMIHLQAFHRLLVHPFRGVEAPGVLALVRHLRSHVVFVSRMA